jgi:chromosomal replication initiator protein
MTESSFPKIGELIGGRKHTTILYAYEKIKDELESHPVLKQQIEEIQARIKPR